MPDISLRLNKDMLVVSSPIDALLERAGVDIDRDLEYLALMEPETLADALGMEHAVGANCLVTPTAGITPARLTHRRMENDAPAIAKAAVAAAAQHHPQHILAEIGPCQLPLDPSSKNSLKENAQQYQRACAVFAGLPVDAFFFNGFTHVADVVCALEGAAQAAIQVDDAAPQNDAPREELPASLFFPGLEGADDAQAENATASSIPAFVSVVVNEQGTMPDGATLEDAAQAAQKAGALVFGFETEADADTAAQLAKRACNACDIPLLVQLRVGQVEPKRAEPTPDNPYCRPDIMVSAAAKVYAAGAQFVRATGAATPAYTGALMATLSGLDVRRA